MSDNNAVLFVGSGTNCGKTTFITGLLRALSRRGIKTAPFKPKNMSNNSAVPLSGYEVSRSIALQAQAANVTLDRHFNPILLKLTKGQIEVVVAGQSSGMRSFQAAKYFTDFDIQSMDSCFEHTINSYQYVIAEGCGSALGTMHPDPDYGNLDFALRYNIPIIFVIDDELGPASGAELSIVGAMTLMDSKYKHLVKGFVCTKTIPMVMSYNAEKFKRVSEIINLPFLGLLPQVPNLMLDEEDVHSIQRIGNTTRQFTVIAPKITYAANTTDVQPFSSHPDVSFSWISEQQAIPSADLVVLPGSRATAYGLTWLKENGWDVYLQQHLSKGGKILGICGGYQMLGKSITDPDSVEGYSYAEGLGLLDVHTTYKSTKKLENVVGTISGTDISFNGYEIHLGTTESNYPPFATLHDGTKDGCVTENIIGTYCHGVLDNPDSLDYILRWAGLTPTVKVDYNVHREQQIDKLADAFEQHLDLDVFIDIIEKGV